MAPVKTTWTCEWCQGTGVVEHEVTARLWDVSLDVLDAHRAKHPQCRAGANHIRVRFEPEKKEAIAK